MVRNSFSSAIVVDAQGRVLAAAGEGLPAPLEGPGVERHALPGGGFLITRTLPADDAWPKFSRAFVHEARSPLNALAIYLELLVPRPDRPAREPRPEASPERILGKANDQVRRIEELLRAFGELWGVRGDNADLAEITRAACRFAEHEALRHGVQLTHEVVPHATIDCSPALVADAVVQLLSGALRARPESKLHLALAIQDDRLAVLEFSVAREALPDDGALLQPGADAFRALGARVDLTSRGVRVTYPLSAV